MKHFNIFTFVYHTVCLEHLVVIKLSYFSVVWVLCFQVVVEFLEFVKVSFYFVLLEELALSNWSTWAGGRRCFWVLGSFWLDSYDEFVVVVFNFVFELDAYCYVWIIKLSPIFIIIVIIWTTIRSKMTRSNKRYSSFLINLKLNSKGSLTRNPVPLIIVRTWIVNRLSTNRSQSQKQNNLIYLIGLASFLAKLGCWYD